MKQGKIKTCTFLVICSLLWNPAFAQDESGEQVSHTTAQTVPQVSESAARDQIEAAYQKEYAFLEAQLRDLRQRDADFEKESRRARADKEAMLDQLGADWLNLQSQAESLQDLLTDAERELESADAARATLEATLLQAESTLDPYNIEAIGSGAYRSGLDDERINTLFSVAIDLLEKAGKVQQGPGTFFLRDGTEVQGRILRIGNIAAYGLSEQGSGALAPAGEGRMKVWSEPATATAASLAAGQTPPSAGIFLFESESKAIEEHASKSVLSVINSGGTIAWIIVVLGLFGLVLIVLRLLFLRSAGAATGKIVPEVGNLVRMGEIKVALDACKNFKGSTARVVAAAVRNLERDRTHLEDIVSEAILHESSHLHRFGAMILVIAAVAPLLGLLGTVTGMITTFDIITEFGTGDPKLLSGGISIALVTTEIGLAVAIPTLLLGNVLSGWAESIKDDMEKGALGVINQFKEHRCKA